MNSDKPENRPPPLVSLFRGLYTRVAQQLGVDPAYVSRVARGERKSDAVRAALSTGMRKIFERAANHDGNHFHGTSRVAAKKRKATKQAANPTLASATKEMAQPRLAGSPEKNEDANHHVTEHPTDRLKVQSRVFKQRFPRLGLLQMRTEVQPVKYVQRQIAR